MRVALSNVTDAIFSISFTGRYVPDDPLCKKFTSDAAELFYYSSQHCSSRLESPTVTKS
jgi:hypothetical protein